MYPEDTNGLDNRGITPRKLWWGLPSLRKLFIHRCSIPFDLLAIPNLVHLALEKTGYGQDVTVNSILDVLRGCSLLETCLITCSSIIPPDPSLDPFSVSLPHLRAIELGTYEVRSGLITHLQFPPSVAVGFHTLFEIDPCHNIIPAVDAQHVLGRVDICRVALAVASKHRLGFVRVLVCFEGLSGSLEITTYSFVDDAWTWDIFFGPLGLLLCHSPRIGNVREVHTVGCSFKGDPESHHIHAAMPNLVSISFRCEGPHVLGLITPTNPLPSLSTLIPIREP